MPPACSVCIIVPLYALALVSLFGALAFSFFFVVVPYPFWGRDFPFLPPVDYFTSPSSAPSFVLLANVPLRAPVFCSLSFG